MTDSLVGKSPRFFDAYVGAASSAGTIQNLKNFSSRFGVELEFLSPLEYHDLHAGLCKVLGEHNVRSRVGGYGTSDYTRWSVTTDSSVRPLSGTPCSPTGHWYNVELISPIFIASESVCQDHLTAIFAYLKSIGAVTNKSCGLHISSSCDGLTANNFKPFVFCALADDMTLLRRFGRTRNHYCHPTSTRALALVSTKGRNHLRPATSATPRIGTASALNKFLGIASESPVGGKYSSVNCGKLNSSSRARIVEYRGVGGDYLSEISAGQLVGIARRLCASLILSSRAEIDDDIAGYVSRYFVRLSTRRPAASTLRAHPPALVATRNLGPKGTMLLHCGTSVRKGKLTVIFRFEVIISNGSTYDRKYTSPTCSIDSSRFLTRENWMGMPAKALTSVANSMLLEFFSNITLNSLRSVFTVDRKDSPQAIRACHKRLTEFRAENSAFLSRLATYAAKHENYEISEKSREAFSALVLHGRLYAFDIGRFLTTDNTFEAVFREEQLTTVYDAPFNPQLLMISSPGYLAGNLLFRYLVDSRKFDDFDPQDFLAFVHKTVSRCFQNENCDQWLRSQIVDYTSRWLRASRLAVDSLSFQEQLDSAFALCSYAVGEGIRLPSPSFTQSVRDHVFDPSKTLDLMVFILDTVGSFFKSCPRVYSNLTREESMGHRLREALLRLADPSALQPTP